MGEPWETKSVGQRMAKPPENKLMEAFSDVSNQQ
jgi:hypothetical protein